MGSIDLNKNDLADANIIVDKDAGWVDQETNILNQLEGILDANKLDAVICVAGKDRILHANRLGNNFLNFSF